MRPVLSAVSRRAMGPALLAALPAVAYAQVTQVPAIVQAQASAAADASGTDAAAHASATAHAAPSSVAPGTSSAVLPAAMPPPIVLVSPSAPLDAKEAHGAALARRWQNRRQMPTTGADGVVRYLYGATMPSVVCAPLMVCALELQPGEVVQPPVTLGDSVRWKVMPGMSGDGASRTTLVMIKPTDAGLVTNMVLTTNRRVYSVKLVSTQHQWMPRVAFDYPDDAQSAWGAYQMNASFGAAASTLATGESAANLDFGFRLSGDNPGWKPVRVYTDGLKTFIEFTPAAMRAEAPALVALANDGGWFSKPSSQVVNYRQMGNRFVVDSVLSKAALVSGVGGSETRVTITRESSR